MTFLYIALALVIMMGIRETIVYIKMGKEATEEFNFDKVVNMSTTTPKPKTNIRLKKKKSNIRLPK